MNTTLYDNRYRLVELLGKGTTANVYRAIDTENDCEIALKIFDEAYLGDKEALKLFEREIKAVARLEKHPGLLTYYGGSLREGFRYLVMDIAKGETLMHYLNRFGGRLPLQEATSYMSQLLSVLSYIHKRGVIHRDIKPQNIRISSDGTLKLCDFGIAIVTGVDSAANGKAVGTVNYISPEQAKGIEVTPASDLYSAGVLFYEMLTGHLPFTSDKASPDDRIHEIIRKHLKEVPIRPTSYNPNIPDALEQIILKAMSKNPSSRFLSADDMLRYLSVYNQNPLVVFEFELPNEEFDSSAALSKNTDPNGFRPKVRFKDKPIKVPREKSKKEITRSTLLLITLFFSLSVIAAFVLYFALDSLLFYDSTSRTVLTKGDLLQKTYTETLHQQLLDDGYSVTVEYQYSPYFESGTVIAQDPLPQSVQVIENDALPKLHLVVATDKAMILLKDYIGDDYRSVASELDSWGITVKINRVYSDRKAGAIVSTVPASGESVMLGDTVVLNVSREEKVSYAYMPNLLGLSVMEAKAQLDGRGIRYLIEYVESDRPFGAVIYQSRPYGEKIANAYFSVLLRVSNTVQAPETTLPDTEESVPDSSDPSVLPDTSN